MVRRIIFWATTIVALAVFSSAQAAKAPKWVSDRLADQVPASAEKTGAVTLLDEMHVDYNERGVVKKQVREIVQILDAKERDRGSVHIPFEVGYSEVTHFRAWLLDPNGKVYDYDKRDTWEIASGGDELHSTRMVRVLDVSDSIREGSVFAIEYKTRSKTVFSQIHRYLQQSIPVLHSVLKVTPPSDWEVEARRMNGAAVEDRREGDTWVWEARDLDPYKIEQGAPPPDAYRMQLGVSLKPLPAANTKVLSPFRDWSEVAVHDAEVNDSQIEPDVAIRQKVSELTEGLTTDWDKLAAIARYTQSVNYVSISTDLSVGGGYKPFSAAEVFERHYGDCKDKTALTRSMLKCLGLESYAVSADIGPSAHVDPAWPSLHQFNHCIVAIPVGEEFDLPAVVQDDALGRLLLFDPTSQMTPFGLLPDGMGGSRILVGSEKTEGLLEVPVSQPEANKVVRKVTLELRGTGEVSGVLEEFATGEVAQYKRASNLLRTETDVREIWISTLSDSGSSAKLGSVAFEDDFEKNENRLVLDFYVPSYARSMRNTFLVFKPFFINPVKELEKRVDERSLPFVFESRHAEETVQVSLPEGYAIDDLPRPVSLETDFARYESTIKEEDGTLVCQRVWQQKATTLPIERYAEVYSFFQNVSRAEQTPVVLKRH